MKAGLFVSALWHWAHKEFGDAACDDIQERCDVVRREIGIVCICGEVLCLLALLTLASEERP